MSTRVIADSSLYIQTKKYGNKYLSDYLYCFPQVLKILANLSKTYDVRSKPLTLFLGDGTIMTYFV